jgi:hypothetical protein
VPDKLEVLPGPGLVARFGEVEIWAGPQATPLLQSHLVNEAQRASQAPAAGDQLANSLIAVLQRGDPEPQAPFALVGPGANGLTLFLHGPVQAWDSGRWLAPQPVPGWMVTAIGRPWPLIVLPYGSHPPPQSQQGNPLNLLTGAVPGSGFVLLRPPEAPAQPAPGFQAMTAQPAPSFAGTGPGPTGYGPEATSPASWSPAPGTMPAGAPVGSGMPSGAPGGYGPATVSGPGPAGATAPGTSGPGPAPGSFAPTTPSPSAGAPTGYTDPAQQAPVQQAPVQPASVQPASVQPATAPPVAPSANGPVDLRNATGAARAPLDLASVLSASPSNQPEVQGVRCQRGHLNHPRVINCLRCGLPIAPGSPPSSGPRPPIGALLADDGSVWSLAEGCLIGSEPEGAPEVRSGALQPIAMRSGPNHTMGPVHAEVQVRGWSAYVVDRGTDGGTWLQGPGAPGWSQLGRNEQRELPSGSHLSCGGRVLTYLSAWPA